MADIEIAQAEADALIAMEKRLVDDAGWTFPGPGERKSLELTSSDKRESFALDLTRAHQVDQSDVPESGAAGDRPSAPRP
jgi:hypothetical protein